MRPLPVCCLCLALTGCYSFGTWQSARQLEPGRVEVTGHAEHVDFSFDGEQNSLNNNYGLDLAVGVENINWLARIERVCVFDSPFQHFACVGPKFGQSDGRQAFSVQLGGAWGAEVKETQGWQVQSTVYFSQPLGPRLELTESMRTLIHFNNSADFRVALNLGAAYQPSGSAWQLRPELGVLIDPYQDWSWFRAGLALGWTSPRRTP